MRISRWVWERSDAITVDDDGAPSAECRDDPGTPGIGVVGGWASIDGATSLSYTPASTDVGRCLRATAFYTDNIENPTDADDEATGVAEAPAQSSKTANAAPEFVDQDLKLTGRPVGTGRAGRWRRTRRSGRALESRSVPSTMTTTC